MKKRNFQEKIRKEILLFLCVGILLMTLFVSVILAFYNLGVLELRLDEEEHKLSTALIQTIDAYQEELFDSKEELLTGFLNERLEKSEVYGTVYAFLSSQKLKADILLLDVDGEVMFTTNDPLGNNQAFLSYMNIVINNNKQLGGKRVQKVYRDRTREQFLILMTPLEEGTKVIGYAAAMINGKEMGALSQDSLVQYVVFDSHRNVFSSNSTVFVDPSSNKIPIDLKGPRIKEGEMNYSLVRHPVNEFLTLAVYQKTNSYKEFLGGSLAALFFIGTLLAMQAYYFSNRMSEKTGRSIGVLTREMKKVQETPTYRLSVQTEDEFEHVADTINRMLDEITELHQKNLSLAELNIETEKKKLDAQFNPHFLYNTLETIRASLYVDPVLANQLILELNDILRYSIDERSQYVSLESDITYLKKYLSIHKKRFDDFGYSIQMDDESKQILVPKLFLLPLIENSLKYGFKYRRDLHIDILIEHLSENKTRIQVKDNGRALSQAECIELNKKLHSEVELNNHHGLWNSKRRIKLMYDDSEFFIQTNEEHTIVEMTFTHR